MRGYGGHVMSGEVGSAPAGGAAAAAQINADLVTDDTRRALTALRAAGVFTPERESGLCAQAMGDRRHGL